METKEILGEIVISRPSFVTASEEELLEDCATLEEYLEKCLNILQEKDLAKRKQVKNYTEYKKMPEKIICYEHPFDDTWGALPEDCKTLEEYSEKYLNKKVSIEEGFA